MKLAVVAVLLVLLPSRGSAEIVGWSDSDGVEHYTNVPEDIPKPYRDSARTVVRETRKSAPQAAAEPARRVLDRPTRRRLAQVVYDRPVLSEDYVRGFIEGLERAPGASGGGDVNINGPLAVAHASASVPYIEPNVYYDDRYPFVTAAFDRGRSRHLTLRMRLQDQFQLDRGYANVYPAWYPALRPGVDVSRFPRRGLPPRFPRETRVMLR